MYRDLSVHNLSLSGTVCGTFDIKWVCFLAKMLRVISGLLNLVHVYPLKRRAALI